MEYRCRTCDAEAEGLQWAEILRSSNNDDWADFWIPAVAAMAKKAGEEPHLNVDKAEASKEIEDLKEKTGM